MAIEEQNNNRSIFRTCCPLNQTNIIKEDRLTSISPIRMLDK